MKFAKRSLSIVLAFFMAFGVFSIVSSADPAGADYTLVNDAIATKLPSVDNRYFYTDEAQALIDDVLNDIIIWNLTSLDQATVDGYVTMINDLKTLLKTELTTPLTTPLIFNYGNGYSYSPVYPYGTTELSFFPFRAEQKAVNTLALNTSKATVPAVSLVAGDQNFTLTLSIGSNALNVGGNIPILFDKTKLEVVGIDNSGSEVLFTPVEIGTNYAVKYNFEGRLNPSVADFWPAIYKTDTVFKAKWAGINIKISQDLTGVSPRCVLPVGQEQVISIDFKVKAGATPGNAVIYVDSNFKKDVGNMFNSLSFIRGTNADSLSQYDKLASYGSTINVAAATATVEIVDESAGLLGDIDDNTDVNVIDALMALKFSSGIISLTDAQKLVGDVNLDGEVNVIDALMILKYSSGIITHF